MKFTDYYKKEDSKEDFEFEVSYLITELRLKFGLTQVELAKKIGTKQPSIARMESGAELPSLRIFKKIADALKISLSAPKFDYASQSTVETKPLEGGIISSFYKLEMKLSIISESAKTEKTEDVLLVINK
jgi:transcriptional regulator with XRE-family HTH domain